MILGLEHEHGTLCGTAVTAIQGLRQLGETATLNDSNLFSHNLSPSVKFDFPGISELI